MLNVRSIRLRLRKLERYIAELEKHQSLPLQEFQADFTAQLAVERALQAAVECCIDVASHLVSVYSLGSPQQQRDLFDFLAQAGYLKPDFASAMGDMVALRNRIVHLYWDVDVERLWGYLQEDIVLFRRFRDFTEQLLAAEEGQS
jgi:uncharacterized protein YutE (UPF0331/DUF86 family)